MKPPSPQDVAGELEGAFESLQAAQVLLQAGLPRNVVSAAYYAIFHAARAALWSHGRTAKTHQGLNTLFSQVFISTGQVEQEYFDILNYGRNQRERADYDMIDYEVSQDKAQDLVDDAKRFIEEGQVLGAMHE